MTSQHVDAVYAGCMKDCKIQQLAWLLNWFMSEQQAQGYNLSDACRSYGEHGNDGAEEIELEIRDRCDVDSQEQDHEGGLDGLTERFRLVEYEKSFFFFQQHGTKSSSKLNTGQNVARILEMT